MNKVKPVLRSHEEIEEIIELWKMSGQTKMAFCREMGVYYQTFKGWTKSRAITPEEKTAIALHITLVKEGNNYKISSVR